MKFKRSSRAAASEARIGEFAASAGVSAKTIRFYESEGLLPPARRDRAGYRRYDSSDVEQLARIRAFQSAGYSLDEIRELLNALSNSTPLPELQSHLRRLDQQVERFCRVRTELAALLGTTDGHSSTDARVAPPQPRS